ncbi:MFS transporter [Spongiactinospora rosea]|uniref:MFS transporter n=1 Tax=Spongiactinospora rosea TaxID=2248750 RepID=A0A366M2W6_9ACTN|nr:Trp biosynthesis-associated membrane protein [Spongiactinospora rosea]RBQ20377.1 MFS transporter [Spongiactinospora rosea]
MTADSRRGLAIWVVACALGAGLTLFAAGRDWAKVTMGGVAGGPASTVPVSGGTLVPVLTPLALAAAASAVAVLATRGLWRRVVGAVLALCGVGAAVAAATGVSAASGPAAAEAAARQSALALSGQAAAQAVWPWPAVALAGGVVLALTGLVACVRGGRWAAMSARYDRPGSRREAAASGDRAMWDALDEGVDPTADPVKHDKEK